jgi:pyruvate dehydrogenase E2 component (dihydrolipoamide acetyltransferase)
MIEEVRLPEISENVESGDVISVLVKEGDFVEQEQSLVELETEKAAFELPSPVRGKVVEINAKEGDKIKVGQVVLKVDTGTEAKQEKPKEPAKESPAKEETKEGPPQKEQRPQPEERRSEKEQRVEEPERKPRSAATVPAAPSVRQLARELGVDIREVTGTAQAGRITADDVKEYARRVITGRGTSPAVPVGRSLPDFTKWGEVERKPITTIREKIADTLSYTWSHVPQVTQYDQADITGLEESRKAHSQKGKESGPKLTVTSIAMKIASLALKEFPKFNSSFDPDRKEIIYKKYYHISVAVETDRGLLVPVVRDVDKKSILQLSAEMNELAEKTRQHKVTPEDMVGGNFTLSNLGGIGGTNFAPIIYWPQVAILGIARAARQPCYRDGRVEPRLILPLSLSYDHRIIDGVEGLLFLRWIVNYLENPFLLALDENI